VHVEMLDFIDDKTAAPEIEVLPAASARLRPCRPKCSQSLGSYKKGEARWRICPSSCIRRCSPLHRTSFDSIYAGAPVLPQGLVFTQLL